MFTRGICGVAVGVIISYAYVHTRSNFIYDIEMESCRFQKDLIGNKSSGTERQHTSQLTRSLIFG